MMMVPMMMPADGSANFGTSAPMPMMNSMMNPFMMPQPFQMPQVPPTAVPQPAMALAAAQSRATPMQPQANTMHPSIFPGYAMAPAAQMQAQQPAQSMQSMQQQQQQHMPMSFMMPSQGNFGMMAPQATAPAPTAAPMVAPQAPASNESAGLDGSSTSNEQKSPSQGMNGGSNLAHCA
jgi:hypothetical protein